jgi:hypothetical protein
VCCSGHPGGHGFEWLQMAFRLHLSPGPSALRAGGLPAEAEAEVASASFGQSSVSQSRREEGVVVPYQFLTRRASRRAG